MSTYQFIIALVTGLPALLVAVGALYHSVATRSMMRQRMATHEDDQPYDGGY